jgi:PAS domain-containing protein
LTDSSDPRLAVLIAARQRSGRAPQELRARRKDGTFFSIEISSVVFKSPDGDLRTCIILRDITERTAAETERERLINELPEARGRLTSLSGLLPSCASCRRICDQNGVWHNLEAYIRNYPEADFSPGISSGLPPRALS